MPRKYLPPVIHHHRLGTALVLIQLLLGALLLALALYFLLWSPQLNIRDVPHWSAVSVRNVFFFLPNCRLHRSSSRQLKMERASPPCNFLGNKMKRQKNERFSIDFFVTFTAIQTAQWGAKWPMMSRLSSVGNNWKSNTGANFDVTTSSGRPFLLKNAAPLRKLNKRQKMVECATRIPPLKVKGQGGNQRERERVHVHHHPIFTYFGPEVVAAGWQLSFFCQAKTTNFFYKFRINIFKRVDEYLPFHRLDAGQCNYRGGGEYVNFPP